MKTFSTDWTNEERIKIVLLLASQIQADIPAGNYGACIETDANGVPTKFRPNMQSIVEVLMMPAQVLEENRASIEELVLETARSQGLTDREVANQEFFGVSLDEARGRIFGLTGDLDPKVLDGANEKFREGVKLARAIIDAVAPVPTGLPSRFHNCADHAETCLYEVQTRDDLVELCLAASTSTEGTDALLEETKRLNLSEKIEDFWVPGQNVVLPRAVCLELVKRGKEEMN